ncbi:MAG TPA: kynureninase, partial [Waddliaceae bacterium]
KSHICHHGLDPDEALIILEPRFGEHLLRHEDIEQVLSEEGASIALVFLSSVNFLTGQVLEMESITSLAKSKGCLVGYDIAHAAGNIPLKLHEWGVDFAVGCSYKYLCSGPGGPGIAYVHNSHHDTQLPRFSGWWGNDPKTRFQMQLQAEFIPYGGAYSWQVSTPSILAMTPLVASLEIFEEAGIDNLRKKSELQTAFLLELLELVPSSFFEIITPKLPKLRGGQLSLLIHKNSGECLQKLEKRGVICDFRPPNIIRVKPSPFYNTFDEIYQFVCSFLMPWRLIYEKTAYSLCRFISFNTC